MFRRFLRHIKEGFVGTTRHFAMCVSSASAVTITLILISVFMMITSNLGMIVSNIEGDIRISALVSYDHESSSDLARIKQSILAIPGVSDAEHHTKEEEYEYYVNNYYAEQRELFKAYEDQNPFHEVFMVSVEDGNQLESISEQIEKIDGIDEANYGGISSQKLVSILDSVSYAGIILVIALCALAIYLVYNTIKITIASRADEISIMRNVGARNGYVRAPFLVEGIIIGTIGAIIPILLTIFGYIYLYNSTGGYLVSELLSLIKPSPYVYYLSGILLGIGIIVGFIGSYISVCKYLRIKR